MEVDLAGPRVFASRIPPLKKRNLSLSVAEENQQAEDTFYSFSPFQTYHRSTITEQKNRERGRERKMESRPVLNLVL